MKKKPAAKKVETLPAIRLRPGTWVAMDFDRTWTIFLKQPKPEHSGYWDDWWHDAVMINADTFKISGFPKFPKSQWNKHLYRVGKSGELIRVEVE